MSTLLVRLDVAGGDESDLDEATHRLRRELLALEVDDVRRLEMGEPPAGAKSGTVSSAGSLVVSLGSSAVLATLVAGVCGILRSWVTRGRDRRIVLQSGEHRLELTGATTDQHEQAIDAFVAALAKGAAHPATGSDDSGQP